MTRKWLTVNAVLLVALGGAIAMRLTASGTVPSAAFLQKADLGYNNWTYADYAVTDGDRAMLEPDALLVRRYTSPKNSQIELAVIIGHRKKSIHTPEFCMAGGGWDTISEGTTTLPMGSAAIVATRMVQQRQNVRMVVTYFFTDGSYSSASLVPFQLNQMLHRFSRRPHLGALVRIRVPVNRSIADSAMLTQDFARDVLPGIVLGLRRAQAGS